MKALADLLKQSDCWVEDGHLEVSSLRVKLSDIHEQLASLGYIGECFINSKQILSINLAAGSWSTPLFFQSDADLWQRVILRKCLPDRFYVLESHIHSEDLSEKILLLMQFYIQWVSLLYKIKDHGGGAQDSTLVYFISTEKGAKKYEINFRSVEFTDLRRLEVRPEDSDDIKYLFDLVSLTDAHEKERREVLRSSLAEILEGDNLDSPMLWLLQQSKKLKRKFQENHDVYLHKFSVNKLLSEIEEKSTDYISKINESVSSSQAKAFAIPGALIAVAALIKNADFFSLLFVCAGLLSVTVLTFIANNIHYEAYDALREQVKRSMARYEVMKNEDAVRVSAEGAKEKLLRLIDKSKSRLAFINFLSVIIFLMGVFYTLLNTTVLNDFIK